jgi:deazaflavin-dependent oxidoreductase (nitroreductase family)
MANSEKLIDAGAWMLENGHRAVLKLTGGRFPRTVMGMQPVELHVIGRKTGQRRSTLLTAPICEADRVVVVASKGGAADHPIWYKNLVANPDVEITIDGETRKMRARTASADEKAELWPTIVKVYKGYDGYQQSTERDIPVVLLTPRTP